MKRTQTIFLLEDEEPQRLALKQKLEDRNFQVDDAGTVKEAQAFIEQGRQYDVAVVDMLLEDQEGPRVTGAEVALKLAERPESILPEFLIYSAHSSRVEYHKQAMRLGAAAFLDKRKDPDADEVILYVRALALRHLLSTSAGYVTQDIQEIAQTSRSSTEAVLRFCREVLFHALKQTLGAPFVLLLTDPQTSSHNATFPCQATIPLPQEHLSVYQAVQNLIFLPDNITVPIKIDPAELERTGIVDEKEVLERLRGTTFVPLVTNQGIRLSLGIVQEEKQQNRLAENAEGLARLTLRYLRSSVRAHILDLTAIWSKYVTQRRATQRLATLRATSRFCLSIGQEQIDIIAEALHSGADHDRHYMGKVQELGEELRDVGEMLADLDEDQRDSALVKNVLTMKELIREVWEDWTEITDVGECEFSLAGDCELYGNEEDIQQAVSSIIGWFIPRLPESTDDIQSYLRVRCEEGEIGSLSKVVFEDSSHRLEKVLRESLFESLSPNFLPPLPSVDPIRVRLGLYLAKSIVEIRNGGALEDLSDELEGDRGHRIVMSLPNRPELPRES